MKTTLPLMAFFGLLAASPAFAADQPAARVEVNFFEPQNYADAKTDSFDTDRGRDQVLAQLKEHILLTPPRYLAQGQHLVINVTNVDLAGEFEPWRGLDFADHPLLREIFPPAITLAFPHLVPEANVMS